MKKVTAQELASLHYPLQKLQGYYLQNRYEQRVFHEKHGPVREYIMSDNSHTARTSLQQTVPSQQDTRKIPLQLLCTPYVKLRHTRNIYHDFAHDKQGSGF